MCTFVLHSNFSKWIHIKGCDCILLKWLIFFLFFLLNRLSRISKNIWRLIHRKSNSTSQMKLCTCLKWILFFLDHDPICVEFAAEVWKIGSVWIGIFLRMEWNTHAHIAGRILQVPILWEFIYVTSTVCLRKMFLSSFLGIKNDIFHALKAHVASFGLRSLRNRHWSFSFQRVQDHMSSTLWRTDQVSAVTVARRVVSWTS